MSSAIRLTSRHSAGIRTGCSATENAGRLANMSSAAIDGDKPGTATHRTMVALDNPAVVAARISHLAGCCRRDRARDRSYSRVLLRGRNGGAGQIDRNHDGGGVG